MLVVVVPIWAANSRPVWGSTFKCTGRVVVLAAAETEAEVEDG